MCLAIPAKPIEYVDGDRNYGTVGGVRRQVNTSLLVGEDTAEPGDYVLVHVGFALSAISEAEANETLRILEEMGRRMTMSCSRSASPRRWSSSSSVPTTASR
ncbi:MAG: HypC/HybG/HupF family hydrogenase formation chaperone [Candidatus Dormibacteraeota bacterium]|nr:HypC/HybG/HupF family hydrogenase formation chaperone [Candidatus Dormibacteraeota bacterium]